LSASSVDEANEAASAQRTANHATITDTTA